MEEKTEEKQNEEININEAKEILEALKEQNQQKKDLLDREERITAQKMLGGSSNAGTKQVSKEEREEKEVVADARKILAGSGFEDDLFPQK